MEITEVRVKLMEDDSGGNERLHAFCSVTFDGVFVVRDIKVIGGAGGLFTAMPSRKLTDRCRHCGDKNRLRARYCNQCGTRLGENRAALDADGRARLHADVAHPITVGCRASVEAAVLAAYESETVMAELAELTQTIDEGPNPLRPDPPAPLAGRVARAAS